MAFEFETNMLKLTSNRRKLLADGESLIKKERSKLNLEKYFDIELLCNAEIRAAANEVFCAYEKQLSVEKSFYSEFHRSFVFDIKELASNLPNAEKEKVLTRSLSGLEENDEIRMKINQEKCLIVHKFKIIIEIFNNNNVSNYTEGTQINLEHDSDIVKVEKLIEEINIHLDNQENLSLLQRKRGVDGQKFFERIFNVFKNT